MAEPGTTQPGGRKALPLVLIALIGLLLIYVVYRSTATKAPPAGEPGTTPVALETTPTGPVATAIAAVSPTPPCMPTTMPECKSWVVLVGPDARTLSADPICIGGTHTMRWTAWDTKSPLKIYFPTSGFPSDATHSVPPFSDMRRDQDATSNKDEWVFQHPDKATTYAGPFNPAFGVQGRRYCFKYDQEVNGQRVDGRIIIQR